MSEATGDRRSGVVVNAPKHLTWSSVIVGVGIMIGGYKFIDDLLDKQLLLQTNQERISKIVDKMYERQLQDHARYDAR